MHILESVIFFPKSCHLLDNVEKNITHPGRSQMTIWRTLISRWIPKATYIPTVYVILIAPEQTLQEHASILVLLLFNIQLSNPLRLSNEVYHIPVLYALTYFQNCYITPTTDSVLTFINVFKFAPVMYR
jgi:hypothetical protein